MDAQELKVKIETGLANQKRLLDGAALAKRDLSRQESYDFDTMEREIRSWEVQLEQSEGRTDSVHMADFGNRRGSDSVGGIGVRSAITRGKAAVGGVFRDFYDYIKSICLEPKSERSMSTWSGADGGFATPQYLMPAIWNLMSEKSFAFDNCWVYPVPDNSGNEVLIPCWNSFDKSAGKGTASIKGNWMSENDTATEQVPQMKQVSVAIDKIGVWLSITRELLSDSVLSSARIAAVVSEAIAYGVDSACLRGSGVRPNPLGIFNSAGVVSATRATANTITYADCVGMMSRIYPPNLSNAIWIVSPTALAKLLLMADAGNHYIWVPNSLAIDGRPTTLLGRPIIVSQHASTLGAKGDLCLIDFSQYLIATRGSLLFQASDSVYFSSDKIAMRGILRAGMHGIWSDSVLPENSSATLGWAAILAA